MRSVNFELVLYNRYAKPENVFALTCIMHTATCREAGKVLTITALPPPACYIRRVLLLFLFLFFILFLPRCYLLQHESFALLSNSLADTGTDSGPFIMRLLLYIRTKSRASARRKNIRALWFGRKNQNKTIE